MPRIKSAIKRVKTSEKSHIRNMSYKSKIKSSTKKFNLALSENNQGESIKYFKDTVSILDKSVNKGILAKNTASRQKANLNKKINTIIKPEQIKNSASTLATPKKVLETQEKPVVKKIAKTAKKSVTKKPAVKKVTKTAKKTQNKDTKS